MRRTLASLILAGLMAGACSSGATDSPSSEGAAPAKASADVTLEAIAFEPPDLKVSAGTTVTWTNQDEGVAHTVTSGKPKKEGVPGISEDKPGQPDGTFEAELDDAGDTYEFTFDEPGTYRYFCAIHAPMTGTVVVTE